MSKRDRYAERWVVMCARRLGFGRNPLRRGTDRVESLLTIGLVLLGLLAVPAAAVLGTAVRDRSEQTAAQHRAALHPVQAKTLEKATTGVGAAPGQVLSRVRVGWVDAAGVPQEGRIDVVVGTKAGTDVTVWLDDAGAIAKPPRPAEDSAAIGAAAGLITVMLSWLSLYWTFLLLRRPLDRLRAEAWVREWEKIAPHSDRNQP